MPAVSTTNQLLEQALGRAWRPTMDLLGSLGAWWQREFLRLLDSHTGRWLLGPPRRTLFISRTSEAGATLRLTGLDGSSDEAEQLWDCSGDGLHAFLSTRALARHDVDLVLLLPADRFFGRLLRLPAQTLPELDSVIAKDMARKTPFEPEEIYHGYEIEQGPSSDTIAVRHWIIRQSFVADALAELHVNVADVAQIEGLPSSGGARPRILLNPKANKRAWYWNTLRLLALGTAILVLVAFGANYWRKQATVAELSALIETSRAKAQKIRSQLDDVDKRQAAIIRLRSDKALTPTVSEIWDNVTATLPSHSWLTEMQLAQPEGTGQGQILRMSGFSTSAAGLVAIFDNAGAFKETTLTAPVTVDPTERRERFSLQMKPQAAGANSSRRP